MEVYRNKTTLSVKYFFQVNTFTVLFFVFLVFFMLSCNSDEVVSEKVDSLIEAHKNKEISNFQMLLQMGTLFHKHPNHQKVRFEYLNRMIISGYASSVLHYYLADTENRILDTKDPSIILFALEEEMQFHLAKDFLPFVDDEEINTGLREIMQMVDSLQDFDEKVRNQNSAKAYANRGTFFMTNGEKFIADWDRQRSLKSDPCNPTALFQQAMLLFDEEKTDEIIRIMKRCQPTDEASEREKDWRNLFLQVARKVEKVKNNSVDANQQLFELANIYATNGFAEIGLRKSGALIAEQPTNPDYLAIHAFVYYQMGDKQNALKYINEAEDITQKRSRLRALIEDM
ncbi:MAG: tetratricopeptide repeat protein [Bacteroidota bacterium]